LPDKAVKLQVPFIQLPLAFDAQRLATEIAALDNSLWKPHPQGFEGNSMLPLVAVEGDPNNEGFAGPMRPTPALERCAYLSQVFSSLQATVGRSRLMRLSGHAEVTRHVDQGYYWAERVRVHIPVLTQPTVVFECGNTRVNMAPGECWIFDTWRQHRVINDAEQSRIHLVIDTVGGEGFWDLVAQGRPAGMGGATKWRAELVSPVGEPFRFPCESQNVPSVMSPWEMKAHFGLLLSDALAHPELPRVHELVVRFTRRWQELWFQHGGTPADNAPYRQALAVFIDAVQAPSRGLMLRNQVSWFGAMNMMVAKYAAGPDKTSASVRLDERQVADDYA
jgi:hypothetical protein